MFYIPKKYRNKSLIFLEYVFPQRNQANILSGACRSISEVCMVAMLVLLVGN
jgi:hypothetical protein